MFSKHYKSLTEMKHCKKEKLKPWEEGRLPRVYCKQRKAGRGLGTRLYTSHCAHGRQVAHILHIWRLRLLYHSWEKFEVQRLDVKWRKTMASAPGHVPTSQRLVFTCRTWLTLLSPLSPKIGFQAEKECSPACSHLTKACIRFTSLVPRLACSIEHIITTKPSPDPVETFLPGCQKMRREVCGDLQTQEGHLSGEGRQSVELPVG